MANTITVSRVEQGNKQFQGSFSEMWAVTGTVDDTDAVAVNDTVSINMTVPGVALGDMVIGTSLTLDTVDGGSDGAIVYGQVQSANTVAFTIHADVGEFAADALNGAVIKMLIGRPAW
jgi:hypothetical protein